MENDVTEIEKRILDQNFIYEQPYFYNNDLALRCELGIGDSDEQYMKNAKKRAGEIFDILFKTGVDIFFFDDYIYDYDYDTGNTICYIDKLIEQEKNRLEFCLGYQKKFRHKIVRDILYDKEEWPYLIRRNRICCYTNKGFNALKTINSQIHSQINPLIHFVSFENDCILSVYDDRGCDVVFFNEKKFKAFYPLLEKYFLEYDAVLMKERFDKII